MAKFSVCIFLLLIATFLTDVYAENIEGGIPTTIEAHPYLVSLQTNDGSRICGGALINENTVVTAASCLNFYDVSQLVVGINNGAKIVNIAASRFDPSFDFTTNENDVGVLRLAEPVNDAVIALATSEPANGASAIVTGWASGDKLVDVPVSILSAEKCSSGEYKYGEGEILDSMLCALAENSQACGGLAGNPVVSNNQLVGVASWGYGCGNKGNPAVLTDLAALRSWVSQTAGNL